MRNGIVEILAIALVVAGCCALVAAAALVATALALAVAGFLTIVLGVIAAYVAAVLDGAKPKVTP